MTVLRRGLWRAAAVLAVAALPAACSLSGGLKADKDDDVQVSATAVSGPAAGQVVASAAGQVVQAAGGEGADGDLLAQTRRRRRTTVEPEGTTPDGAENVVEQGEDARRRRRTDEPAPAETPAADDASGQDAGPTRRRVMPPPEEREQPRERRPVRRTPGDRPEDLPPAREFRPTNDNERELLSIQEDLDLKAQESVEMGQHLYDSGYQKYLELRYRDAVKDLAEALRWDPDHREARVLHDKLQWILGNRKGEVDDIARRLAQERMVKIHQAKVEVERLFNEGRLLYEQREYDKAIERFERVLETLKWFPYFIDESEREAQAKHWIGLAQGAAERQAREFEAAQRRAAIDNAHAERVRQERYHRTRVATLFDMARERFAQEQYERTEALTAEILDMEPGFKPAELLQRRAKDLRHLTTRIRNHEELAEQLASQIEGVEASAVPYQQIFSFPSKEDWKIISARAIDVPGGVVDEPSPEEDRIRQQLEAQPVQLQFDSATFMDTINFLRDVTDLNFVVSVAAQEEIDSADKQITLRLSDIRLGAALTILLDHLPGLSYKIRYDAINIVTGDDTDEELILEFYDVSDIINELPDFPAPPIALLPTDDDTGGSGLTGGVLFGGDEEEDKATRGGIGADKLAELVEKKLGEDESVGSVEMSGGYLMMRKPRSAHVKVMKLLEELRKNSGVMVTVEARFIDVQDNFLSAIGFEYKGLPEEIINYDGNQQNQSIGYWYQNAQLTTDTRAALVNSFNSFVNPLGSSSNNPFFITPRGGALVQYNVLESYQLQAIFDAVKKEQQARLVSAPRVTVFDSQRSHVLAISQEAYIRDVEIDTAGVFPVLNPVVGILNSGAILEARPMVSYDRRYVTLEVKPTLAVNLTTDANVANLNISQGFTQIPIQLPTLRVQNIQTTITVPDGGTVLLGGMKDFRHADNRASTPLLGHIPLLKFFFQREGESTLRRSVVVLIKCDITIIREQEAKLFSTGR